MDNNYMKKFVLIFILACMALCALAQESVPPVMGRVNVAKVCDVINIEGSNIYNATIFFKTNKPDYVFITDHSVKVTVKQGKKTVYHRKFKNAYLYIFTTGQVQVGRPRFDQIIVQRQSDGKVIGIIREYEGIYL